MPPFSKRTSALVCLLFAAIPTYALADTHWANPAGSNTPPYTSYATGAHYLQDAVAALSPGDTIRIVEEISFTEVGIRNPGWSAMGGFPVFHSICRANTRGQGFEMVNPPDVRPAKAGFTLDGLRNLVLGRISRMIRCPTRRGGLWDSRK